MNRGKEEFSIVFRSVAPMLLVDDVNEAVVFYRDVFGARLQHSLPEAAPFQWVSLLLGDVELMFWQKEAAQREYPGVIMTSGEPSNLIVYVYVENIDALYEQINGKIAIIMEPKDQFYGIREFTVRDPFGFFWTFAQVME